MVSHEHQCIFVHIPKTAGNSINRIFGVGWEDHKDLGRYHDEMPRELFENYFKFAVVRNPWDRLLSDYNYQLKKSREKDSKLFVFTEQGSKRNFAEWVEVALGDSAHYQAERWGGEVSATIHRWSPQVDWISVDGIPRVDFVARIERLQDDFTEICRRLNLPAQRVPHRNRRLHLHYSRYYDRATRDIVSNYYAKDIELFGYEFEQAIFHFNFGRGAKRATEDHKFLNPALAPQPVVPPPVSASPFSSAAKVQRVKGWRRSSSVAAAAIVTLALVFTVRLAARTALLQQSVQQSVGHVIVQSNRVSDTMGANPVQALRRVMNTPSHFHLSAMGGLPVALPFLPVIEVEERKSAVSSAGWPVQSPGGNDDDAPRPRHSRLREQ